MMQDCILGPVISSSLPDITYLALFTLCRVHVLHVRAMTRMRIAYAASEHSSRRTTRYSSPKSIVVVVFRGIVDPFEVSTLGVNLRCQHYLRSNV